MKNVLLSTVFVIVLISCSPKGDSSEASQPDPTKQSTGSIFYSRGSLDSALDQAMRNKQMLKRLGESQEGEEYMVITRTEPGQVEVHELWDDVAIIRSGKGTLRTGNQSVDTMKASGEAPARNWFGQTIQNPIERRISAGDFAIIPAMTAHQYIPDPGDTLTYWTIKVKRSRVQ